MEEIKECPKCKSEKIQKNGCDYNRLKTRFQKYKCNTCGHVFRDSSRLGKEYIRIGVFSDLHCGHVTGLTPEKWNDKTDEFSQFRRNHGNGLPT